mmetsp:Transcript_7419/g.23186  ORF Transcript_7419/g.23186 Transcript_7419/m.23186 type:complete len:238 (+) Transcript_7419:338-1051(+)
MAIVACATPRAAHDRRAQQRVRHALHLALFARQRHAHPVHEVHVAAEEHEDEGEQRDVGAGRIGVPQRRDGIRDQTVLDEAHDEDHGSGEPQQRENFAQRTLLLDLENDADHRTDAQEQQRHQERADDGTPVVPADGGVPHGELRPHGAGERHRLVVPERACGEREHSERARRLHRRTGTRESAGGSSCRRHRRFRRLNNFFRHARRGRLRRRTRGRRKRVGHGDGARTAAGNGARR